MEREDLSGKRFGDWLVLEYAGNRKWKCQCQCQLHTIREVSSSSLKSGRSTCCGIGHDIEYDLSGQVIGELLVKSYTGKDNKWLCECSCGAMVEKTSKHLRSGNTRVCGPRHRLNIEESKKGIVIKNIDADIKEEKTKKEHKYKPAGDWEVLHATSDGYYMCRCICGYTKEMSDSAIWHARKSNYTCRHTKIIGRKFVNIKVLDRINQKECLCVCDCNPNKTFIVTLGNLLNGSTTSCGCTKKPTYTREELIAIIQKYMNEHQGIKPHPLDLLELTSLRETAIYENIHRYNLEPYLEAYSSVGEDQLAMIFNEAGLDVIRHDRKVLLGKELDIYVPELKLALEYNGSFWHSEKRKDKLYHQNKTLECASKGIRLIHIFDYEWNNLDKRDKIKAYLNSIINNSNTDKSNILYARNLNVIDISSAQAKEFNDKHHLQGHASSKINIALVDSIGDIKSVMSFGTPRFNNNYQYELIRYCNRLDIKIVGGAEKLFKYFITRYKPESILTYVDISKFTGNIYLRLGFNLIKPECITSPNYVWVSNHLDKILTRYDTQKHKLIAKGLGDANQTEDEIMNSLNYFKVYDCGNLKLEWIR